MVTDYPRPPPPPQKKEKIGSLPAPRSGYATTIMVFFLAHLLILEYPDHHQNLISSSLYYPGPLQKISSQSVHNFLSNVHRQTNKQTNATKNITSFAKEVIMNLNAYGSNILNLMCGNYPLCLSWTSVKCVVWYRRQTNQNLAAWLNKDSRNWEIF